MRLDTLTSRKMSNNRWISVENKLPEPGRLVWYITKNKSVFIGAHIKDNRNWYWVAADLEFYVCEGRIEAYVEGITSDATHWHPIPEPPKIERG